METKVSGLNEVIANQEKILEGQKDILDMLAQLQDMYIDVIDKLDNMTLSRDGFQIFDVDTQ